MHPLPPLAIAAATVLATAPLSAMHPCTSTIQDNFTAAQIRKLADDGEKAAQWLAAMPPDGSWADLDYNDRTRGSWPLAAHLSRLRDLALAWRAPQSRLHGSAEARDAVLRGLGRWADLDPVNPNWWWPQIGVPLSIAPVLLLLGDEVPAGLRQRFDPILARSKPGMTGQNRLWLALIHLQKGVLADDTNQVAEAAAVAHAELHFAKPGEGLQRDFSYQLHGPQLQIGNYGLSFYCENALWAELLQNTPYAYTAAELDLLHQYYENGMRWFAFAGYQLFSGCGRQIAKGSMEAKVRSVATATATYSALPPPPGGAKWTPPPSDFTGNRYFPCSETMVHRTRNAVFAVRMHSRRTVGTETINDENLLGRHTASGAALFASRAGRETLDTCHLWDWRAIPGTTIAQDTPLAAPNRVHTPWQENRADLVGGVSDGIDGLCAMAYDDGTVSALKSYFFFGDTMLAIGTRIHGSSPARVLTAIAQVPDRGGDALPSSSDIAAAGLHLRNGAFTYDVPAGQQVEASLGAVTGNWHAVTAICPDKNATARMLRLALDHGVRPSGASYIYRVCANEAALPPPEPLATASDAIHAARRGDLVGVAFFEAGSVALPDGRVLHSDGPAFVLLRGDTLLARRRDGSPATGVQLRSNPSQAPSPSSRQSLPAPSIRTPFS